MILSHYIDDVNTYQQKKTINDFSSIWNNQACFGVASYTKSLVIGSRSQAATPTKGYLLVGKLLENTRLCYALALIAPRACRSDTTNALALMTAEATTRAKALHGA